MKMEIFKVVIGLAEAVSAEREQQEKQCAEPTSFATKTVSSAGLNIGSQKAKLRDYLDTLSDDELRDLVAIMYMGRGDSDSFQEMRDHVKEWDRKGCIIKLLEKSPLSEYIRKGISKL